MAKMNTEFLEGGSVAVIRMTDGENRINVEFLTRLNRAIDEVERNPAVQILITTGSGKFYSNGLDLQWLSQREGNWAVLSKLVQQTFSRILTLPVITIAAINGHAFAGGAFLSMAHDLRVMRSERGWICLNEIFIKAVIPLWLIELIRSKIPSGPVHHSLFIFGKRFTAAEAVTERLVNRSAPGDKLLQEAVKLGREILGTQTFDRDTLQGLKRAVFKKVFDVIDEEGADLKARL